MRNAKKSGRLAAVKRGDDVGVALAGDRRVAIVAQDERDAFLDRLRALQEPTLPGFRWSRAGANAR